jgi:hypothetical protein
VRLDEQVMGVLTIGAAEADFFDPGVIEVLVEASHDLALGIRVARAEVERSQASEQLRLHRDRLEDLVSERTAAGRGQGGGRGGQPGQERLPGQHEPRDPHPDERHHRPHPPDGARSVRGVQRERLRKVDQAAQHLLQVINDILDLSKIEAGKMQLEHIEFSRDALLSGAWPWSANRPGPRAWSWCWTPTTCPPHARRPQAPGPGPHQPAGQRRQVHRTGLGAPGRHLLAEKASGCS